MGTRSATGQERHRSHRADRERPQHPQPDDDLDDERGENNDRGGGEEPPAKWSRRHQRGTGSGCKNREVCDEPFELMAVATAQHGVDALIAFFEAQASLADRLGHTLEDPLTLGVGCQHRLRESGVPGVLAKSGSEPPPGSAGLDLVSNSLSGHQQGEQEGEHKQRGGQLEQRSRAAGHVVVAAVAVQPGVVPRVPWHQRPAGSVATTASNIRLRSCGRQALPIGLGHPTPLRSGHSGSTLGAG